MAKKTCFVLGSGGSRGIAHIGFLQAMDDAGIRPDCIAGCSMGSVVGACYAKGVKPAQLKAVADNLKFQDIADFSVGFLSKKSIFRSVKMRNRITELLGDVTFDQLEIPFECVAVDIISGKLITLNKGRVADAVSASSSIPLVFKPVEIDGYELVDGGVVNRLPIANARDFGAEVTIVVDVLGALRLYEPSKNMVVHGLRCVEVNDCYLTEECIRENKPDLLIRPELGDMSQYKVSKLAFAYEEGYKSGVKYTNKIKELMGI